MHLTTLGALRRLATATFRNVVATGNLQVDGNLTVTGTINADVAPAVTAHAGGGQASATALTHSFSNITVVASSADSVKLPASTVGRVMVVSNQGANSAQIFGTDPDTINGVATGTGISIPVGAIFVFTCAVVGNWLQNVQDGGAFTGTFDGVLGGNTPAAATVTTLTTGGAVVMDAGSVVINEASGDYDFRVESNGNANAIFVDASTDRVGIFTASPAVPLDVTGAIAGSTTITAGTNLVATAGSVAGATTVTAGTYLIRSVGNALTAVGTDRATALQLAKQVNNVTTAASGTGVILPVGVIGMRITIFNAGANLIKVYASASETIDGTAGSAGVDLTNAKRCDYFFTAANTWISAQLGVVSA